MKLKFSKFERVAGLFVGIALGGAILITIGVAVKQGWFSKKVEFRTTFERANGIFPGTRVEMSGLKIGAVDEVEFQENDSIIVHFSVLEKFANRIKEDSYIQTSRMFIIGDKIIDIAVGSPGAKLASAGALIPVKGSFDILELLDSRNMGSWVTTMGQVSESLKLVAEAFADQNRTRSLVAMVDKIDPFLNNANKAAVAVTEMSNQMTINKNLKVTVENLAVTTSELNKVVQAMPNLSGDMTAALKTMTALVGTLNQMLPAMQEMAPQMPHVAKRAVEALDEAVVTLKAMQRSFLLSGSAKDVRKEEAEAKKKKEDESRMPASEESN